MREKKSRTNHIKLNNTLKMYEFLDELKFQEEKEAFQDTLCDNQ